MSATLDCSLWVVFVVINGFSRCLARRYCTAALTEAMGHVWGFSSNKGMWRLEKGLKQEDIHEIWDFNSHCLSTVMHKGKDCLAVTKDRSTLFILATKYDQGGEGGQGRDF